MAKQPLVAINRLPISLIPEVIPPAIDLIRRASERMELELAPARLLSDSA